MSEDHWKVQIAHPYRGPAGKGPIIGMEWRDHGPEYLTQDEAEQIVEFVDTRMIRAVPWHTEGEIVEQIHPTDRIREVDYDLDAYLRHVGDDLYNLEMIANIHAEVPGHNDEDAWYWVIELTDGSFVLTIAHCDCTGWDCQAWGESERALTAEAAAMLAPEDDYGRRVREHLLAQLHGLEPFGTEMR